MPTKWIPLWEEMGHNYRLATKARFIGIQTEFGKRARKVGTIVNDPEADLVYTIDEVVI